MKRRSKAGGKSAKAQPSESLKLKPDTVPKPAAGRSSAIQQMAGWLAIGATGLLRRNMLLYGLGGVIAPFIGIKLIDLVIHNLLGV